MQSKSQDVHFYRLSQLKEKLSVSRSSIWSWVRDGSFPKPIKLGKNCTAWNSEDVHAWVQSRIDLSK
jgi:prophage regulatory protein